MDISALTGIASAGQLSSPQGIAQGLSSEQAQKNPALFQQTLADLLYQVLAPTASLSAFSSDEDQSDSQATGVDLGRGMLSLQASLALSNAGSMIGADPAAGPARQPPAGIGDGGSGA